MSYDEFIEKYGDVVVTFSSYYKYRFRYSAILENGNTIIVEVGGDASEIDKWEVQSGDSYMIRDLELVGGWMNDQDGFHIETFYF